VNEVNNLGITLTSKLDWSRNVHGICRKIIIGLRYLYQFGNSIPQETKLRVVQALFIPHLLTSDVVMGELSANDFATLQKACNSITRYVFGLRKYDHISHVSNKLLGMPLKNFMMYHRCLFLFKLLLLKKPIYLFEKLELVASPRFPLNLISPVHGYLRASRRFFVHDVCFWNAIPNDVKLYNSVNLYKSKSQTFFKNCDINLMMYSIGLG
jgi:hypothetical protein